MTNIKLNARGLYVKQLLHQCMDPFLPPLFEKENSFTFMAASIDAYYVNTARPVLTRDEFFRIMMPYHGGNPEIWAKTVDRLWNEHFSIYLAKG